jgi:hypothetical protein
MKNPTSRVICAVLAAAAAAALAACGGTASPVSADTAATTAAASAAVQTEAETTASLTSAVKALPDADFGGYTFTVMDRSVDYNAVWYTYDVFADATNGDPINDAVYERNGAIEEKYDMVFAENPQQDVTGAMRKLIAAGDASVDMFTDGLKSLVQLIPDKMMYDLNEIPDINLSAAWWDPEMTSGLSVAHKSYFATGDISIMDNEGTWCVLFNKSLAKSYSLGDLYSEVTAGKWTLDSMYDKSKAAASDIDGDGTMTLSDQWGYLGEPYNTFALWGCTGEKIISKDDNDLPYDTMYTERGVTVYDKVLALQYDTAVSGMAGIKPFTEYQNLDDVFSAGRALFQYGAMALVSDYRSTDTDFGIVPAPKFDESQESYYSTYSTYNLTANAVPVTQTDLSRTGQIMEALAVAGQYTLTPAYYDVQLKGKFVRDNESADMLDLILEVRNYDLGAMYDWGGAFSLLNGSKAKDVGNFASKYAKIQTKLSAAIDKFVGQITG